MDARQLGYFLAIVDHGGFGRAAMHLLVAQPSLSQAMRTLERDLGGSLFRRAGRGVTLTDAGARLVGPARRVLRDLEAARDVAAQVRDLQRGRVDLTVMPSPGIEPLTTLLATFVERYPAMTANVEAAFTPEEVVEQVRSGVAEIGLMGYAGRPATADLRVLDIEEQPLVLVSRPGDDLPAGEAVSRTGLDGLRIIASQRGSLMRQLVDDILADGGDVRLTAEIAHRTSILPMVRAGLGHAVLPSAWSDQARRLGLEVRRIEPVTALRVAAATSGSELSPGAVAFMGVLLAYVARRGVDP